MYLYSILDLCISIVFSHLMMLQEAIEVDEDGNQDYPVDAEVVEKASHTTTFIKERLLKFRGGPALLKKIKCRESLSPAALLQGPISNIYFESKERNLVAREVVQHMIKSYTESNAQPHLTYGHINAYAKPCAALFDDPTSIWFSNDPKPVKRRLGDTRPPTTVKRADGILWRAYNRQLDTWRAHNRDLHERLKADRKLQAAEKKKAQELRPRMRTPGEGKKLGRPKDSVRPVETKEPTISATGNYDNSGM